MAKHFWGHHTKTTNHLCFYELSGNKPASFAIATSAAMRVPRWIVEVKAEVKLWIESSFFPLRHGLWVVTERMRYAFFDKRFSFAKSSEAAYRGAAAPPEKNQTSRLLPSVRSAAEGLQRFEHSLKRLFLPQSILVHLRVQEKELRVKCLPEEHDAQREMASLLFGVCHSHIITTFSHQGNYSH